MIPISDPDLRQRCFPFVNVVFIALNALVFLYELALGSDRLRFVWTFGLIPAELTAGTDLEVLCTVPLAACTPEYRLDIATPWPAWTTLFTAMFMHGDIMHFGSNMIYLWVFGDNIEDEMGHYLYPLFYLAAGLAATGAQIMVDTESQIPVIGASGAIAGVLAAYLLLHSHSRIRTIIFFGYFITWVHISAVYLLGFWFILQFFSGLGSLTATAQSGGVAYWAHIGGFLFGIVIVGTYVLKVRHRRRASPYTDWDV